MILVETYSNLVAHDRLTSTQADVVARELLTGYAETVVVALDDWIPAEKDFDGHHRFPTLVTGEIDTETEKALLISEGDVKDWIPKSCACVFELADDADLSIPQSGLDVYADGGQPISFDTPDAHGAVQYLGGHNA